MNSLASAILRAAVLGSTAHALCLADRAGECCSTDSAIGSLHRSFQPTCTWYRIWRDGDTLAQVSKLYVVSGEYLEELNCFLHGENVPVKAGTAICISTSSRKSHRHANKGILPAEPAEQLAPRSFTFDSNLPMVTLTMHDLYGPEVASTTELPLPEGVSEMTTRTPDRLSGITTLTPVTTLGSEAYSAFMTNSCDAGTDDAEDCRISMDCDKGAGMYPICDNGICRCVAIQCLADTQCDRYGQCRSDDEIPECRSEPILYPEHYGICACRPRITDCFRMDDPNLYCGAAITCHEKMFSGYVEYAMCDTQDDVTRWPLGRCSCHPVDCDVSRGKDAWEACNGLVACVGDDEAPYCSSRYLNDGHGRGDGYCSCRTAEGLRGKNNSTQAKLLGELAGLPAQVPAEWRTGTNRHNRQDH